MVGSKGAQSRFSLLSLQGETSPEMEQYLKKLLVNQQQLIRQSRASLSPVKRHLSQWDANNMMMSKSPPTGTVPGRSRSKSPQGRSRLSTASALGVWEFTYFGLYLKSVFLCLCLEFWTVLKIKLPVSGS